MSCALTATNADGTQRVLSPASGPVSPRDLSHQPRTLVGAQSCRTVIGPRRLRLGGAVALDYGHPVTARNALTLRSRTPLLVALDGVAIDVGRRVGIDPEQLAQFADGAHTLSIRSRGRTARAVIALSACRLAVRVRGGVKRTSTIEVSGRTGMGSLQIKLPRTLRLAVTAGRAAGIMSYTRALHGSHLMGLVGPRSSSDGIEVSLTRRGVRVTGLPAETGVVRFRLRRGVLRGGGGTVRATSTLRGTIGRQGAAARSAWTR